MQHPKEKYEIVDLTTLDDWMEGHRVPVRVDIIKLDLEGMEPAALAGAEDTITRHKPIIIAEAFICTPEAIVELLPDYAVIGLGADVLCVHKDEDNAALHKEMVQLAEMAGARQVR